MDPTKIINLVLSAIGLYREVGGNVQKLLDILRAADEEGRDLTDEELAEVMADAQDAVNRL
ncbi:MAG: hypothetical protein V2I24_09300 [Halieaceae bacterium]|jgi:hypothetical protein|nr:hypothetical protein [Halieaceae bacterium]